MIKINTKEFPSPHLDKLLNEFSKGENDTYIHNEVYQVPHYEFYRLGDLINSMLTVSNFESYEVINDVIRINYNGETMLVDDDTLMCLFQSDEYTEQETLLSQACLSIIDYNYNTKEAECSGFDSETKTIYLEQFLCAVPNKAWERVIALIIINDSQIKGTETTITLRNDARKIAS